MWAHSYQASLDDPFFEGGPTSTPTVDEGFVYTLSRRGELFCFDAASGRIRWSTILHEKIGIRIPGWGFAGSPLVHEHLLLLSVGEAGTAVDKSTGKVVWTSANHDAGYTTPVPLLRGDKRLAIVASGKFFLAVETATGRELWRHRWLAQFGCNAADPIIAGDHLFISSGYNRGCALLQMTDHEPTVGGRTRRCRISSAPACC